MHLGDHLVVAGPSRSGRSSALALLADQLSRVPGAPPLFAVCPRARPLAALPGAQPVRADDLAAIRGPAVVLVDDAELVEDPTGRLAELAAGGAGPDGVSLVVAGRHDALRAAYGHWTQVVRRQRRGVLLRPGSDVDGDLLGAVLPRRAMARPAAGRGYVIVDGICTFVQLSALGVEPDQGSCAGAG